MNPTLQSDQAFQLYLTALVKSDAADSIDHAVKRREQVLGLLTTPSTPGSNNPYVQIPSSPPSESSPPQSFDSSPHHSNPTSPPQESLSRSQQVAHAVLATKLLSSASYGGQGSSFIGDRLLPNQNNQANNALGVAGGGKENPIFVTVSEREDIVFILYKYLFIFH